ncbi:MAG: class I SAM-dependent methyltransferase [Bacteroidia bacterium]
MNRPAWEPSSPPFSLVHATLEAYELVDIGEGERLERWGSHYLIRPESQAWIPRCEKWDRYPAHRYHPTGSYEGYWSPPLPAQWEIVQPIGNTVLTFIVRPTSFKHVGLFPEQAPHWRKIYELLLPKPGAWVLNLFAYTGASSVVAAAAGARVTHVDVSKSIVSWAYQNAEKNGISTIRWMVEDARTFVQKERRRGRLYDAILLDPPTFGVADKKRWHIEKDLVPLLDVLVGLLAPGGWLLLHTYTGLSVGLMVQLVEYFFPGCTYEVVELSLRTSTGRILPTGLSLWVFSS